MLDAQRDDSAVETGSVAPRRKHRLRRFLLVLGPLVVCVGAASCYWFGGRYVETDNAYVKADMVSVSAEVAGPVTSVIVQENQLVKKGDPLFTIDPRPYTIALAQADARLQGELVIIRTLKANYREKENELEMADIDLRLAEKEYKRQAALDTRQAVAKSTLDNAVHDYKVAQQKKKVIAVEMEQILAKLEGDPDAAAEDLADYRLAKAQREQAALDLERTTVRAPFSGRVSKLPKLGYHITPGTAVLSLVADDRFWIEANVKETNLTHVRPGQKVDVVIDTFPGQKWQGEVESISPATGSEFSVIPAENATGNWVKVVQRVPVRIGVTPPDDQHSLRVGMSATISIDTTYRRPLVGKISEALGRSGNAQAAMSEQ